MTEVTIALLGAFELRVGGQPRPVPSSRQRALLAALALSAGRAVPVESLVELVWGEDLQARPRANVQTLVTRVRALAGADLVRTVPGGYLLDLPAGAVDVLRFQRLVDEARRQPAEASYDLLREALELWRGDPLADAGSEALVRDRAPALVELYLAAVERRADLDLARGAAAELTAELTELVTRYPLREPLWARLVLALDRAGRPAEALAAYHRIRTRLGEELGSDPSPELQDLYARLLAGPTAEPDGPEPECAPPVPRQLPADVPSFVGRDTDLAVLDALLAGAPAGGAAVAVVHGPGGVGKSALVLRWAHRVADRFPDGQLHLDLRGFGPGQPTGPAAALEVLLRALGVPDKQVPPGVDERAALLRTAVAGKRLLLVLDNAHEAEQVRPLLPGAGSLVLVTSRNQLRGLTVRDGATGLALRELAAAESAALVAAVVGADRAAAEPAAVAELAALCGGLPLALVIAAQQAVRLPDASLAELVADLRASGGRLDLLADPDDPATDPRTVLSWSYRRLEPARARTFRLLGLHPPPRVTLCAAAALLGTDPAGARRQLDGLVSVHLLEHDRPDRYRLHDLLAVYATEVAAEEPAAGRDAAERRLLDWFLHSLHAARTATFAAQPVDPVEPAGPVEPAVFADLVAATGWYHELRPVLLALVELAYRRGDDEHCWRLGYLLRPFHQMFRHVDDQVRATELAVLAADRLGNDWARVRVWHERSNALAEAGRHDESDDWLHRALALGERTGDHNGTAAVLASLGMVRARRGDLPGAVDALDRSVAAARRTDQPIRLAHSLLNLGYAEGEAGRLDASDQHNLEALAIYRKLAVPYQQALVLYNLAENALDRSDHDGAVGYADEALALLGALDDTTSTAGVLIVKGRALAASDRPDPARDTLRRALRILRQADDARVAEVVGLLTALDA
jgi:DNA-binding SARP family transcriptional activator